jgi:hypothetical protein
MFLKQVLVKKEKLVEKKMPFLALALAMCVSCTAGGAGNGANVNESTKQAKETFNEQVEKMKVRIKVDDKVLTATLIDSKTARDFVSQLPLTLTLEDYAATEKISDLPQRLSTEGAPSGSDPSVGDIAFYAPWGNLAIFYKDSGYANGLIILGKIDGDAGAFNVPGSVKVTIESVK